MRNNILFMLAFLFTGLLSATDNPQSTPEAKAKRLSEKMKAKYSLSDDQYNKVYVVNLETITKRMELRGKDGSPNTKVDRFKELETQRNTKFKEILTAEQYTKWTKDKKNADKKAAKKQKKAKKAKKKAKVNENKGGKGKGKGKINGNNSLDVDIEDDIDDEDDI